MMLKFTDAKTGKSAYLDFEVARDPKSIAPESGSGCTLFITRKGTEYRFREDPDSIMDTLAEAEALEDSLKDSE